MGYVHKKYHIAIHFFQYQFIDKYARTRNFGSGSRLNTLYKIADTFLWPFQKLRHNFQTSSRAKELYVVSDIFNIRCIFFIKVFLHKKKETKVNQVRGEISENIAIHIAIRFEVSHCKIQRCTALVLAYMTQHNNVSTYMFTYPCQYTQVYTSRSIHTCVLIQVYTSR